VFPWLSTPYPNHQTDYAILTPCCIRKDTGICMHCVIVTGTNTVQRNNGCVVWLYLKKPLNNHTLSGNRKNIFTLVIFKPSALIWIMLHNILLLSGECLVPSRGRILYLAPYPDSLWGPLSILSNGYERPEHKIECP
jgi:hypothetical protein